MTAKGEHVSTDITLRLTLRRGWWSSPNDWNWAELLDLAPTEECEIVGRAPNPEWAERMEWLHTFVQNLEHSTQPNFIGEVPDEDDFAYAYDLIETLREPFMERPYIIINDNDEEDT